MTTEPPDTDCSKPDVEARVREEIARQPEATIVAVWEPEDGGVFVAVERPGSEDQPL